MPYTPSHLTKKFLLSWQILFITLATSWLWAPLLNPGLSSKISRISDYEALHQPYSWLFRLFDFFSGLLLLYIARVLARNNQPKTIVLLISIIGIGFMIDVLIPVSCRPDGNTCIEYLSVYSGIHFIESFVTASAILLLSLYSLLKSRQFIAYSFIAVQLGYLLIGGISFLGYNHYDTLAQFVYQSAVILWLAWFCYDRLKPGAYDISSEGNALIRNTIAAWIFVNGIAAILASLAHIHLLGKLDGLYFANDTAWLAQHGVIIGVSMLYLSRHLARGEMRARQLIMALVGLEVLKYSLLVPNPALLAIYLFTFLLLLVFRDSFYRRTQPLTRALRLKDLYVVCGGLAIAATISFFILDRDEKVSGIARTSYSNFFNYAANSHLEPHSKLTSILLAHTLTVFLASGIITLFWIMFKPSKTKEGSEVSAEEVKAELIKYSADSEDFFKLWPSDKEYYRDRSTKGIVAYKVAGSVAFALSDPIGRAKDKTLDGFLFYCRSRGLKACFMLVRDRNAVLYKRAGLETIQVGSSALVDIRNFLDNTTKDKWWRWQKNRATKTGNRYSYSEPPHSSDLLDELSSVSDAWLSRGKHVERGFALGYFDRSYMQQCTIHYLTNPKGTIIAFANQLPVLKPFTTASVDLIRFAPGENGAMPILLLNIIEHLAKNSEDIKQFDLGFVPFAQTSGPAMKIIKIISSAGFSSSGLQQFKNKFDPKWESNYIAYDGDVADLAIITLNLEKVMKVDT